MLVTPREDIDDSGVIFRYFEYVPSFMSPVTRIEWDVDSMYAVLAKDIADFMVRRGYARDMHEHEVAAYNKQDATVATQPEPTQTVEAVQVEPEKPEPAPTPEKTEPVPAPKKSKKGDRQ